MRPRADDEDSLLRWLRRKIAGRSAAGSAELLGDDAAKLALHGDYAVTMDCQIEGVHFHPGLPPAMLARRSLAVNLSDLAAMGAAPRFAFLSLTAPAGFDRRGFFRAFLAACRHQGLELAGGDLSRASHVQVVITLLGERQGHFLERSAATAGDRVYLGGEVGIAGLGLELLAAGARPVGGRVLLPEFLEKRFHPAARRAVLRHLLPQPQLALGSTLAKKNTGGVLDVSDGLAKDLHRLCSESRVGARIEASSLPMAPIYRRLAAQLGKSWRQLALGAGEDYVLLFTLPPHETPPPGAVAIGRVIAGRRILLVEENGNETPLPPLGFDHLRHPAEK